MDITTFHELLQKHPSLSKRVFEMLVKRISYLTEHYVAAMHDSSITRLKTCLAYLYFEQLIDMKDNDLKQSAPLSIHQGEIASHIGFSRQMTNQLLGKLSQEGTIRIYRNTIVFLNARSLLNTIEI
jgi:CRP-like cAMP-binding protein